jgi:two-component system, NarL family, sensor histidine kinase DegS
VTESAPHFSESLNSRRFWMLQVLVVAIATTPIAIEAAGAFNGVEALYLVPVSLFVIPILYAAFTFGLEGAMATTLWCVLLTVPPVLRFESQAERIEIVLQLGFLLLVGAIVAIRVDRERRAKLAAEDASRRLAASQVSLKNFIGLALRAQEEERFRLSRFLHDDTVQELVTVKGALEDVPALAGQRAHLEYVDAALARCIDGIRRFSRALRPSVLDDLGLVPALDWLLSDLEGRTSSLIALEAPDDRLHLSAEQELVIFRVAQQALHNIEHHAHASQVLVRLKYDGGRLCLEVIDNGCGFDPENVRPGRLGLAGMKERACLIGATLTISSFPGSTCVRLDLPPGSVRAANDRSLTDSHAPTP